VDTSKSKRQTKYQSARTLLPGQGEKEKKIYKIRDQDFPKWYFLTCECPLVLKGKNKRTREGVSYTVAVLCHAGCT